MQSDRKHLRQNTEIPLADEVGSGYIPNPPIGSIFGQNVDFQPSKICPRNFIIFDRTDNRSQIMYHPAMAPGFAYPGGLNYIKDRMVVRNDVNDPRENESVMKEDSADIDLLLSFEEEDEEEEEEVSTGRTHGNDDSDTADSCSSRVVRKSKKHGGLGVLSSSSSQKSSERKREKMRKMVDSLRGIVPGGNRMNTVGVLDEAVKYLKSLKVELQKVEN